MPGHPDRSAATGGIAPSDLDQSVVRLLLVALLTAWAVFRLAPADLAALLRAPVVMLCVAFFAFTVVNAGVTVLIQRATAKRSMALTLQRCVGITVDTSACATYALLSGPAGVVVFPLFLTIIIGYGLRFGLGYMAGALVASLVGVTAAAALSTEFAPSGAALVAYYLALFVVPLYTASLVRKYQTVLAALRRAHASRARFVSLVSHELRTPLHAILGQAETIADDGAVGRGTREAASTIVDSGEQLHAIVNDLLAAAAGDAGALQLGEYSDVDLPALLTALMPVATAAARDKPVTFEVRYDDDAPRRLHLPARELRQALTNVIGNAAKYCDRGRVEIAVARQRGSRGGERLTITVTDDGPGIDRELEEVLFEPFTVGRRRAGTDSTGLGLPLTRHYLEAMGGAITVASEPGSGTSVRLELPVIRAAVPAEASNESSAATSSTLPRQPMRAATIAIVDDNPLNRRLAAATLTARGHTVFEYETPQSALAALTGPAAVPLDLLLVDFHFEDGSSERFLETYRAETASPAPALSLSADGSRTTRARASAAGAVTCLTKPVRPSRLVATVERILAGERSAAALQTTADRTSSKLVDRDQWVELLAAGVKASVLEVAVTGFGADAEQLLHSTRRCLENADAAGLRAAVHRLEGSAAAVFADRLGDRLKDYRPLGDGALMTALGTDLEAIELLVERTRQALEETADSVGRRPPVTE